MSYILVQKIIVENRWQYARLPVTKEMQFCLVPNIGKLQKCQLVHSKYSLQINSEMELLTEIKTHTFYFRWPLENVIVNLNFSVPNNELQEEWAQRLVRTHLEVAQQPDHQRSPLIHCLQTGMKQLKKLSKGGLK